MFRVGNLTRRRPAREPFTTHEEFVALVDRLERDFPDPIERKTFLVDAFVMVWNERGRQDAELIDERMRSVVVDVPLEAYRDHLVQAIRWLNR